MPSAYFARDIIGRMCFASLSGMSYLARVPRAYFWLVIFTRCASRVISGDVPRSRLLTVYIYHRRGHLEPAFSFLWFCWVVGWLGRWRGCLSLAAVVGTAILVRVIWFEAYLMGRGVGGCCALWSEHSYNFTFDLSQSISRGLPYRIIAGLRVRFQYLKNLIVVSSCCPFARAAWSIE